MTSPRSITRPAIGLAAAGVLLSIAIAPGIAVASRPNLNTLAGKVAALRGTAGLQVRFSAFIEQEAIDRSGTATNAPIDPTFVLSSPLDGHNVQPPAVTVNQDTAAAPQNETAIATDPNNPNRVVAAANDYVSRTWSCSIDGTPCSALGDGYSGTYFSNDGGATWCCTATGPNHLGTLIPGVERLTGGPYDAGGDPALDWDSHGHVYYAGLGFNRTSAPNTVTVSRGTFSGGDLHWGGPTFVNATTSPSTLNDKEWISVDHNPSSAYRDRIYLTWTRFLFNPSNGKYTQSPIFFAASTDGGATFTSPKSISGNVLYDQGSRPVVGPDGTLYVFWNGSTRLQSLNSTWVARSTNGGASFSKPVAVSQLTDSMELTDTLFRVNSFPAAASAPNGDLYATWTTETKASDARLDGDARCADWLTSDVSGCFSYAVWSKSTDGGRNWSAPSRVFPTDTRDAEGYPVAQPSGGTLHAPAASPVEDIYPAVAVAPNGKVYVSAYRGDVVSPWQTCANAPAPPEGRINCLQLGDYIDNTRLDYVVRDASTSVTRTVSPHPINTRNGFGGGFFGDYTDLDVGSDNTFHAFWTDSNNRQTVVWFYGLAFDPTVINQEDVVTASGNF